MKINKSYDWDNEMSYHGDNLPPQLGSERAKRINARNKGRRGEQEVATMLRGTVDEAYEEIGTTHEIEIKRNLMQWGGKSRSTSQSDITGLEWLSIEVKRVENELPSGLKSWWEQCKSQARRDQIPVLFHRMNDQEWKVRLVLETIIGAQRLRLPVDISWSLFRIWLKMQIKHRAS